MPKVKETLSNAEIMLLIERQYGETVGIIQAIDSIVEEAEARGKEKVQVPEELMLSLIGCLKDIDYLAGVVLERNSMLDNSPETQEAIKARKFSKDILESISKRGLQDVSQYLRVYQDKHHNRTIRAIPETTKTPAKNIDREGNLTITEDSFRFTLNNADNLKGKGKVGISRTLDFLTMKAIENNTAEPYVSVTEYMETRGIKDRKEAKKQIKEHMNYLGSILVTREGEKGSFRSTRLCSSWGIDSRGYIHFRFVDEYYQSLSSGKYMHLPNAYFKLNDNDNRHSALFLRKISEHKWVNAGKPNADTISVKALIASSPTFPQEKERNFLERQLEVFEKNMDVLGPDEGKQREYEPVLLWNYRGEAPSSYEEFISAMIEIEWLNYPDNSEFVKRRQKEIAAAKKKKDTPPKKNKRKK